MRLTLSTAKSTICADTVPTDNVCRIRKNHSRHRGKRDALTLDVFKSEYHKLLEAYFAENFVLDPELDRNASNPHFYHAFYVYNTRPESLLL